MTTDISTGCVAEIMEQQSFFVRVILTSGTEIEIKATHKINIGDWIVEGEVSRELALK
ncbi:hypothetical protein [Photobacterium damselae]|uniref:hypothetical protein n=1 Tax=Photobacterium damselae TaxID=38293 RepID=UPI000E02D8D8|nr:hypothetical protein [Photobacterium damselae]SUB90624.1 Uncharacterised protein [Photobacterium damselae]